jgi:hypothetical protein
MGFATFLVYFIIEVPEYVLILIPSCWDRRKRADEQGPSEEGMVHSQSSFDPHSGHVFLLWLNHLGICTGHVTRESTHHV